MIISERNKKSNFGRFGIVIIIVGLIAIVFSSIRIYKSINECFNSSHYDIKKAILEEHGIEYSERYKLNFGKIYVDVNKNDEKYYNYMILYINNDGDYEVWYAKNWKVKNLEYLGTYNSLSGIITTENNEYIDIDKYPTYTPVLD